MPKAKIEISEELQTMIVRGTIPPLPGIVPSMLDSAWETLVRNPPGQSSYTLEGWMYCALISYASIGIRLTEEVMPETVQQNRLDEIKLPCDRPTETRDVN